MLLEPHMSTAVAGCAEATSTCRPMQCMQVGHLEHVNAELCELLMVVLILRCAMHAGWLPGAREC
jgi:hypothetical protein